MGGQSGTVQLGTTFGPGVRQQAFVFDGVDDYVSIPDSPVLDSLSTNATLDAWIKPEIPLGAEAWLFARRDPFVSEGFSVALLQDGRIQLTARTTTSPTVSGSTFRSTASVITFDQWQHVAAAVDTVAGTAQIWVNGQAISLTAVFDPATLSGTLFNVNQQYLGRRQDPNTAGGGGHFKGELMKCGFMGGRSRWPRYRAGRRPNPWRPMSTMRSRDGQASRSRTGSRRRTLMIPPHRSPTSCINSPRPAARSTRPIMSTTQSATGPV
ncbi:MAG: LamG domain-containing protein [Nitrospira sp.]|nr:LamG domain-containing protein [Nitrospira sp.]MBS0173781.1 LamG domain-containing protein [Nitrospira sp.]MBX3339539.1 LamG domain-containing protein [Nitrospira sp.]MCW5779747.1 LamG domain-containing protein [Nitrospira sp.]